MRHDHGNKCFAANTALRVRFLITLSVDSTQYLNNTKDSQDSQQFVAMVEMPEALRLAIASKGLKSVEILS